MKKMHFDYWTIEFNRSLSTMGGGNSPGVLVDRETGAIQRFRKGDVPKDLLLESWEKTAQGNDRKMLDAEELIEADPMMSFFWRYHMLEHAADATKTCSMREYEAVYNFHVAGLKVFNIRRELIKALLLTDLKAEVKFVKLPYPCVYLSFEPFGKYISNPDGTRQEIAGMYVFRTTFGVKESIRFVMVSRASDERGAGNLAFGRFDIKSENELITREKVFRQYRADPTAFDLSLPEDPAKPEMHVGGCMQLCVNVLLYISSCEDIPFVRSNVPEIKRKFNAAKSGGKRKNLQRKLDRSSKITGYIDVGVGFKRPLGSATSVKGELTYRFTVRGHWRKQWIGSDKWPQREENPRRQKMKWIEPFEKGPDGAEVVNRPYRVGEDS